MDTLTFPQFFSRSHATRQVLLHGLLSYSGSEQGSLLLQQLSKASGITSEGPHHPPPHRLTSKLCPGTNLKKSGRLGRPFLDLLTK